MKKLLITAGGVSMEAVLNDGPSAGKIWDALPIEGTANRWGDEIYFRIPLVLDPEPDARPEVEVGDIGYGLTGKSFCIFFGPTPASTGDKPTAAGPVNILGRLTGDPALFRKVESGTKVSVSRCEDG